MDKNAPPLATRATVPPALDALLVSALAKDPDARPGMRSRSRRSCVRSRAKRRARELVPLVRLGGRGDRGLHKTPSPTNLNDSTRGRTPRVPDAALENAGAHAHAAGDDAHGSAACGARGDDDRCDRVVRGAARAGKRAWLAVGATVVALALAGVAAGARWTKGRTPAPASAAATRPRPRPRPDRDSDLDLEPDRDPTATPTPTPTRPQLRPHACGAPAARSAACLDHDPKSRLPPSDL